MRQRADDEPDRDDPEAERNSPRIFGLALRILYRFQPDWRRLITTAVR